MSGFLFFDVIGVHYNKIVLGGVRIPGQVTGDLFWKSPFLHRFPVAIGFTPDNWSTFRDVKSVFDVKVPGCVLVCVSMFHVLAPN